MIKAAKISYEEENGTMRVNDNQYLDVDEHLQGVAWLNPDKIALEDSQRSITWREFDLRLNQIANALIKGGVEPNDRVAVLASNSVLYATLFLAIGRAGACVVPLSTLSAPETLAGMVTDSGAKYLFLSRDYADYLLPYEKSLTGLVSGGLMFLDEGDEAHITLDEFIQGVPKKRPDVILKPQYGFNLIYSSGTTGTPKGILQNRHFRAFEAKLGVEVTEDGPSVKTLVSTPLYSNTTLGIFLYTLQVGGTVTLMEKFNTAKFLALSEQKKITHAMLVPVQYTRLLNEPDFDGYDLSSYQAKFSTSAPLHSSVKQELLTRWPAGGLTEYYGMTEGGVVCVLSAHDFPDKLNTVGRAAPGCDLKIIGEDNMVVSSDQPGELVGWYPAMMDGYHNRSEATEEASWYDETGKRYHRSGDIGWMDEDGFIHLLDRKKDMIISGGLNIYAIDLEKALLAETEVSDVAVIAAPSDQWGETPIAFIVVNNPVDLDVEMLRERVNGKLGKAQRISEIRIIESLPRSSIGKILKRKLKELLVCTI